MPANFRINNGGFAIEGAISNDEVFILKAHFAPEKICLDEFKSGFVGG
jgi:hypothetical protein